MRKSLLVFLILFFILFNYPLKAEKDYSLENIPSLNPKGQGIAAKISFTINNQEQIIYSNPEGYFYLEINQKIPSKIEAIINYKDKVLKTYLYILEISENIPKFPKAKWCLLTYLDGNSNLENYFKANLADLENEGSEAKIHLMVLFLRKSPHKSADLLYLRAKEQVPAILSKGILQGRIFLAENEFSLEQIPKYSLILKYYEKLNPQENLADFLKIAFEYFPSEYYLLNISSHGNGYKSLGFLSKNFLFELKKILNAEKEKIDILGFDACLMGMTEVAYEFKDLMKPPGILIASPESSAAEGWPYSEIIKFLKNHPDLNPLQLSKNILAQYIKFYNIKGYLNEIMAVLNLYYMQELAEKMESFSQEILRIYKVYKLGIKNIRKNSLTYYEPNFIDLTDFANKIILADLNPSITKKALDLKETINKVVLLKGYTGGKIKKSGGISIFFPMNNSKEKIWEDLTENSYQDLTFLSQGASPSWYSFIKEFNK